MLVPLALLPVCVIVLTGYALRPRHAAYAPIRLALVRAGVLVGALTVVGVELLGAMDALTTPVLVTVWALGCGAALAGAVRRFTRDGRPRPAVLTRLRESWHSGTLTERVLLLALAGLILAELIVALLSPPNNYDSMTYHLPKVEHWAVQHNVGFFATRIHRQDSFAPGAEYLLLQLRLLTGAGAAYNLVQWAAGLACALIAARIVGQLGGGRRAQLIGAFVVGTTPMVALESSSTQTDLVVAAWVACLATLVLDELRRRTEFPGVLLLGAATGLITLTKATGLLAAGPLLLLWGVTQLRLAHSAELRTVVRRVARTLLASLGIMLVAGVVAGGYLHRANQEFGSPLGPDYSRNSISMQRHDPAAVLVNGLRIAHTLFDTPLALLDNAGTRTVTGIAHALHVNPNDPKITFVASTFPYRSWRPDEDSVSYPIQAALVLIGAVLVAARPRRTVSAEHAVAARGYALTFLLTVVLYPAVIKWQPWGNRLFLFALVLGGPLAALWLDAVLRRASRQAAQATQASHGVRAARGVQAVQAARGVEATRRVQAVQAVQAVQGVQAAVGDGGVPARRRVAAGLAIAALAIGGGAGWAAVGYGWPRRLVGGGSVFTVHGTEALFNRRQNWRPDYEYVAAGVRASGAKKIGLAQNSDSWEYPWWYLLPGTDIVALQSVLPHHPPAQAADTDAVICTVSEAVCAYAYTPAGWTMHWHGSAGYALPPGR